MAKFIEVHMKSLTGSGSSLVLQNLDDISGVYAGQDGEAVVLVKSSQQLLPMGRFWVEESYAQLRLMIGAAQGGIPMDTGGSY